MEEATFFGGISLFYIWVTRKPKFHQNSSILARDDSNRRWAATGTVPTGKPSRILFPDAAAALSFGGVLRDDLS
jgi:hypothetical protein